MGFYVSSFSRGFDSGGLDGLSEVLHVLFVDSGEADSSGLEQVDVELINQDVALLLSQASVREHADLVSNVLPVARSSDVFQSLSEESSHVENSLSDDISELSLPFLEVVLVVEYLGNNFSSVSAGARVDLSDDDST
jgi:hypothetical protein